MVATLPIDQEDETLNRLTEYGKSGYELISVVPLAEHNGKHGLFYFKRAIED